MKKNLTILVMLAMMSAVWSIKSYAQINLEHKYTLPHPHGNFRITNLGNNNYKYVVTNFHDHYFDLYNLDHTPFILNITNPLLTDTVGGVYNLSYISSTLFDCDSTTIEYVLLTVSPNPNIKFYIYRTDGSILFSRDSVTMPYCTLCGAGGQDVEGITNTSDGAKMFLFNSNNDFFVYDLCGSLPENIIEIDHSSSYVTVFPNPASDYINFKISPPGNIEKYELIIFNSAFQTIKNSKIDSDCEIVLDCNELSSGTYFFSLQNKNKIFQTGQFIITK
jgi:hypothetical protein